MSRINFRQPTTQENQEDQFAMIDDIDRDIYSAPYANLVKKKEKSNKPKKKEQPVALLVASLNENQKHSRFQQHAYRDSEPQDMSKAKKKKLNRKQLQKEKKKTDK